MFHAPDDCRDLLNAGSARNSRADPDRELLEVQDAIPRGIGWVGIGQATSGAGAARNL